MNGETPGHPRMLVDGRAVALSRIEWDDRRVDEGWLQRHLDEDPGLLPIDDISSAWGPLVSLGRELPLAVGFVDYMFVSPAGELTMVEAKLWRNPQARRAVIGQILDYASALSAMSYEDLERMVIEASPADERSVWQRV